MTVFERVTAGLMLVVALIHLLPVVGLLGADRVAALYGVKVTGPDLEILLRHRASLFGILGALFAYAAFVPEFQPLGFCVAAVSIGSFFFLAWSVGGYNGALGRVVIVDVVAALCLVGAVLSYALQRAQ